MNKEERKQTFLERLNIQSNGCWIFCGSINEDGYGNVWVNGQCLKAHRYSYEIHVGPIPEGMLVCHTCDNPPCCNPEHLYVGTNADNTRDKMQRGRFKDISGDNNPSAFLSEHEAREIHKLILHSNLTQQEIANQFKISKGHVNNIKMGRAWPNLRKEFYNDAN